MSTTEPTYLTRAEVAERLRLKPKTLANWASAGKGPPCIRLGGRAIRYPRKDFDAWERTQPRTH
ncbi:helix-turn-helix transcriptional regulator [Nocardia blacklockiae]|uniref:helix-turn-helix transcriptional regulator n=1 Tax=Nocardia blacklockiae TaxID=480036 RepID=UPI0018940C26|nr:helix-turn-helix domain-containing protein [Nocardia blacklockiae]MBF6171155.1 helix-turn-helix domain-containing protein [Nocardia blacklockiae]